MAASAPSFAHMLPGYGVLVSRFDRPNEPNKSLDFNRIRQAAKTEWLQHYESFALPDIPPPTETSYTAQYAPKKRFPSKMLTWEERANNPHPSEVFLCTHLKNLPGFYNRNAASVNNVSGFQPRAVSSKEPYKVDASSNLPFPEKLRRQQLKEKRPATGGDDKVLNSFIRNEPIYRSLDPETAQATEAWLKMAKPEGYNYSEAVQEMLEFVVKKQQTGKMVQSIAKPEVQKNIHNWLKTADKEKVDAAHKLFAALESGKLIDRKSSTAFRYSPNVYSYERLRFRPKPREFKLHPDLIDRDHPPPIRTNSKLYIIPIDD